MKVCQTIAGDKQLLHYHSVISYKRPDSKYGSLAPIGIWGKPAIGRAVNGNGKHFLQCRGNRGMYGRHIVVMQVQ